MTLSEQSEKEDLNGWGTSCDRKAKGLSSWQSRCSTKGPQLIISNRMTVAAPNVKLPNRKDTGLQLETYFSTLHLTPHLNSSLSLREIASDGTPSRKRADFHRRDGLKLPVPHSHHHQRQLQTEPKPKNISHGMPMTDFSGRQKNKRQQNDGRKKRKRRKINQQASPISKGR